MSRLLYTLAPISGGSKWAVELGIRTIESERNRDRTLVRSSFDRREQATLWLQTYATLFRTPGLPERIADTKVLLPLGGELPNAED